MSLQNLRDKLNQLAKKKSEDTFTFDISEAQKLMKGNAPEDWLEYTQHVKENVEFPNDLTRHNSLSDLYERALQDLDSSKHKNNEAYAQLFVNYARLKSDYLPDDANVIFYQAAGIVRKHAIVHVAWAEFEMKRENQHKAKKILEKGLLFEAKPAELLHSALQKLKEGKKIIYEPPESRSEGKRPKYSPGSDVSEEMKSTSLGLTDNVTENTSQNKLHKPDLGKVIEEAPIPPRAVTTSLYPTHVPAGPADSSIRKPAMRTFRSTPLLNSEKRANVGMPGRVKRINLPFQKMQVDEDHEEEEMNTMDSFKPLTPHKNATSHSSHGHTSGYQSMLSATDFTLPMETKTEDAKQEKQHGAEQLLKKLRRKFKFDDLTPEPQKEEPVEKPVAAVQKQLPKPVVPEDLVPATPNNKNLTSTPMPSLQILSVNDQQYGVIGVMGHGGSSKVYQVLDANHKIKAIKVVNLDNANDLIVEGYKNEIKLLKRLQYCDKVIKMYDSEYKSKENKLYVVMEAGNEDLASFFRSRTKNKSPLSSNLIRFYWEIMLEGVQALHKEGIIHSDLKPANFLLVGGNLKLIDFGIAKALQQDKTSVILETQIGTLNYMSPEAIMDCCGNQPGQGKPKFKIGVKSDVWSLGCILYNMVYGRTPFQHIRNEFYKLNAIMNADYPLEFPDIPNKHLLDVMKRCLCRDPKARPSIDELLAHPYLRGDKEVEVESPQDEMKVLGNKKMEALISLLADSYSLSPGGIRNIIQKTIDTDQAASGAENQEPQHNVHQPAKVRHADMRPVEPSQKPKPLVQRPEGPVTMKQVRAPLANCLNLQDFKPSASNPHSNYKPSGS